jgi:PGF-CTERM protein
MESERERTSRQALCVMTLLLAVTVLALVPSASAAATGPDDTDENLTLDPSHEPGLTRGAVVVRGASPKVVGTVNSITVSWPVGGSSGCGPANAKVFGVDRGGDDAGTAVDESLFTSIKSVDITDNRLEATFYGEDDFVGDTLRLDEGDQFVAQVTDCIDTPDQPGWYRLRSTVDGSDAEFSAVSDYFWVCDCADEAEARRQLGPPPSEASPTTATPVPATPEPTTTPSTATGPTPTAAPTTTPTAAPDMTVGSATTDTTPTTPTTPSPPTATVTTSSPMGRETPSTTAPEAASTQTNAGRSERARAASTASSTPVRTPTAADSWSSVVERTPTTAQGPGFGAVGAVLALLWGGLLAATRRP